jgi:hypothetical protein
MVDTDAHCLHVTTKESGSDWVTVWSVDGQVVAKKKSANHAHVLTPNRELAKDLGALRVRFSTFGGPQRVTWYPAGRAATWRARTGIGGIDLDPEPRSPAALREEQARRHPWLYAARHLVLGVAAVAVPLLLAALAIRLVISLPWPDVSLPSVPWPDWQLPSWQPPLWVDWIVEKLKLTWPVLLALVLAGGEIRRRRKQERTISGLQRRKLESDVQDRNDD